MVVGVAHVHTHIHTHPHTRPHTHTHAHTHVHTPTHTQRPEELIWTIDDNEDDTARVLSLELPKKNQMEWWKCIVEGHEEIDTSKVRRVCVWSVVRFARS